jgi:hypothetical protein
MFKLNDKVFISSYTHFDLPVPFNRMGRFVREHLNGRTCAVDVGKFSPNENGIVCANLSDITLESPAEAKVAYLKTGDGQDFVDMLRPFEHTLYAKVRYPDVFFKRYEKATGVLLKEGDHGILISRQESKYGDEMTIKFKWNGVEAKFPFNAHPRLYNTGKGILNDNEYIWALIEDHGFRFGKV